MKKAIATLTIECALASLLYAGPEPLPSGKEMKQVAPAPAPECPNWTGFYIGGFGGYKFAATDLDLNLNGSWDGPVPGDIADAAFIESRVPNELDASGAEAGGLIGYNYQWNNWVFGLEADGGYLWLRDSDNTGTFVVPATTDEYTVATSLKTHYLVTVAPRIGYAFCRWLPYVTGGLAVGDIDYHQEINQFNQFAGGSHFFQEGGSTSDTKLGWMVGGGLEYAINNHWRLRGQYQFIDLGCVDFDSAGTSQSPLIPPGVAAGFTGNHEACLREHNASFAIMYKF
jgi:outer membrane immunogenic protein